MSAEPGRNSSPETEKLEARVVLLGEIIVACNKPATKLLLSPREEILGQSFLSFSVSEQVKGRPSAAALRLRAVAAIAGQSQKFEWILKRNDGGIIRLWVHMQHLPVQGKNFVQLKLYPRSRPFEIDEAALMFKMGIERSNDAVFMTDTDGQILYTNPAFEKIYGYSQEEAVGKTPRILKSGIWSADMYRNFWESLLRKETVTTNITNKTKDGRLLDIEGSNNPILDDSGNLIGFLAIHRDATDRRLALDASKETHAALEQRVEERTKELAEVNKLLQEQYDEVARVKDDLEQRNLILEALNELSVEATSTLTPDFIYQKALVFTSRHIDCTSAYVRTINLERNTTSVVAEYIGFTANDAERQSKLGTTYNLMNEFGVSQDSLRNREEISVIHADDDKVPTARRVHMENNGAKSILEILLTVDGEPVAEVEFWDSREKRRFHSNEIGLVKAVIRQIAVPIKNARLYQQAMSEIDKRESFERDIKGSLERRSRQVRLSAQLSKDIIASSDLPDLYQRAVNQIQDQFGYYHTQILRFEPSRDSLVLVAGYGEIGKQMLKNGHFIPLGKGLVGLAAENCLPALIPDVSEDPDWLPNPLLPETKGELVLPIFLGDEILGVLDVQSDEVNSLNLDDQITLEGLCAQIAVATESTRLRQNIEHRLQELNQLQRLMSHEGWQRFFSQKELSNKAYRYDTTSVKEIDGELVKEALNSRSRAGERESLIAVEEQVLSTPMKIRGETIGALGIHDDPDHPLTEEDRVLLDSITVQVAEALENARLLEETKKHALEMEAVAEVSAAASSILDVGKLLDTVANQTRQRFGLYYAGIYLLKDEILELVASTPLPQGGEAPELGSIIRLDQSNSIVATSVQAKGATVLNDTSPASVRESNSLTPDVGSQAAIPILVGNKVLGIVRLMAEEGNRFNEEEIHIHTTLAAQIAVALQNARLYAEQLETAERLREVDRLKSEFLAGMSHELRTPLNSIIGFADVLLEGIDGPLTDRMKEDVSLIRDSGRHLRTLISEMLDMSKIEAGVMELRYEKIHAPSFAEDIMANARTLGKGKDLEFKLILDPDLEIIEADRTRLTQILLNLLTNAIKFTNEGAITLKLEQKDGGFQASVIDTGIGIYDEDMPNIFEHFQQVDRSLTRRAGGTGLGLPISQSLIKLHGGELQVKSIPGEGSVFRFFIPGTKDKPSRILAKKVMAIEDNPTNLRLIARVVEAERYEMIMAADGVSAIEQLDHVTPDLILLDINIPGLHGLDLARQIKNDQRLAAIPLIATTANVLAGDRDRCLEAGCDDYIAKPINISKLREMLHDYLD